MAQKDRLIHTTALVTLVIILSKVFGLARDVLTAGVFGTGVENDAYASAYTLFYFPVLMFNSCITATVVPLYVQERRTGGLKAANRFASNALNVFLAAALIVSALMFAFAGPIVRLVYNGFDAAGMALTVRMTRIMMVGLMFNIASIVLSSVLNALDKFMVAQLTGFPLSVAVILSVWLFSGKLGILSIACGVLAASVLQALILIPFLTGSFKWQPVLDLRDEKLHRLVKLAGPAVLSMGISEVNHLIDRSLASALPTGTVSAMNYGYKLITLVLGVLMVPLTTIMFSRMSRLAAEDDTQGLLEQLRRSITLILAATLPILAVATVMSTDVVRLVYMRGSFTEQSALLTGGVLLFYLIGVPAFGLRDLMNRVFHALKDTSTPFIVACVVVGSNITLNFILRAVMGARGLALATSLAGYIGLTLMFILLRKKTGRLGMGKMLPELAKLLIAAGAAAAVCALVNGCLHFENTTIMIFLRLVIVTAAAFTVYAALCAALKCEGAKAAIAAVKGKIRRR